MTTPQPLPLFSPRIKIFDACEHSIKVLHVDTSVSPWTITIQHAQNPEHRATLPIDGHSADEWIAAVHERLGL